MVLKDSCYEEMGLLLRGIIKGHGAEPLDDMTIMVSEDDMK